MRGPRRRASHASARAADHVCSTMAAPRVLGASAWFEGSQLCLLAIDWITPELAVARADGPHMPRLGEAGRLHVRHGGAQLSALQAVVRRADLRTRRVELGLAGIDLEAGVQLARWACETSRMGEPSTRAHRETLESAAERAAVLRFLVERAANGTVHTSHGTCTVQALAFDASSIETTWSWSGTPPAPPFLIALEGYNSLFRIPVPACRVVGARLYAPAPPWIEAVRLRRARRARVEGPGVGLCVEFDHPLWPALRVERPLLDLTRRGLSFAISANDGLYPGLALPRLLVVSDCGECIAFSAMVRSARGPQPSSVGCEVWPASEQDAARWLKLCDERLFPDTRRGAAEVWSVYRASGYFDLSETLEGAFDHLRSAYVRASRALSGAPELGCQATWPAAGSPKATVTNLRLTPSCWFSYHLAAQPDEALSTRSMQVLRDLYRQYIEHCLATPGPRWQMAYVQHGAHWSMRVHVDIPRRYVARGEALVRDFRALEVRTVGRALPSRARCAQREERTRVLKLLQARLPRAYFEALDYAPELFDLAAFKAQWACAGLERDRELLVAFERDELMAAGVVECAEPGLHLFGLLDTLRLYATHEAGEQAFPELLELARAWFRERGRRSFCYLEEEGQLATDGRQIKAMSPAYLTLLSVERLPEMLEYLHADTASR